MVHFNSYLLYRTHCPRKKLEGSAQTGANTRHPTTVKYLQGVTDATL